MKLSFKELLEEGGHFEGACAFKEDDTAVEVDNYTADFFPTEAGLYMDLSFSYSYSAPCARCLEPVKSWGENKAGIQLIAALPDGMTEEVELTDDDMGVCYIENDEIDLEEMVRQEVVFYLPVRVICSDDCKGLCPACGADLNQGPCKCAIEADPRWSALNKLKNN
ncbi:MAG: DUF177 domain-containing protein [Deferribacterales bacterium]